MPETKVIVVDLWDFFSIEDMEALNEKLDEAVRQNGNTDILATDIQYKCLSVKEDGTLSLIAEYSIEAL